jgi:hypothetical protein
MYGQPEIGLKGKEASAGAKYRESRTSQRHYKNGEVNDFARRES